MTLTDSCYGSTTANIFTRGNIELTFILLRRPCPSLALAVQNVLIKLRQSRQICDAEQQIPLDLNIETVNQIVDKLAKISQSKNQVLYSNEELIAIRCLLMDWLIYAQSLSHEQTPRQQEG